VAGRPLQADRARHLVRDGKSQGCLVIPKGFSAAVRDRAAAIIAGLPDDSPRRGATRLEITFDPAVRPIIRQALLNGLLRLAQAIETRSCSPPSASA